MVGFSRGQREHSAREAADLLGVPRRHLRALARAAGLEVEKLSFQDLAFLRRLVALEQHPGRARRLKRALERLREDRVAGDGAAGQSLSLSSVGLVAAGAAVAVRDEHGRLWNPESRQGLLDFEVRPPGEVTPLASRAGDDTRPLRVGQPASVDELFEQACALEEDDPASARLLYREVLALAPTHAEAHVNLGRLLHVAGEFLAAEGHYRRALLDRPDDPTATFNLGVVLEDQERDPDAVVVYLQTLALDPTCADAHYNLAQIFERAGDRFSALRHLRAYRRLTQGR